MTHARDQHGASARILLLLTSIITLLMMPSTASAALPSWSFDASTGVLSVSSSEDLYVAPYNNGTMLKVGCIGCSALLAGINPEDIRVIRLNSTRMASVSLAHVASLITSSGPMQIEIQAATKIELADIDGHDDLTGLNAFPSNAVLNGHTLTTTTTATHITKLTAPKISVITIHGTKYNDRIDLSRSSIPIGGTNHLSIQANLGSGDDTILGPPQLGSSEIYLGDGNDTIRMPTGNNRVFAGGGNDTITTGTGKDSITANAGNDTIRTGPGNDAITDLTGYTTFINSGPGDDAMSVYTTTSRILTGRGRDSVNVFARRVRRSTINLGSNNDQIVFRRELAHLTLDCGPGNDLILFRRPRFRNCERSQVP